MRIIYLPDYGLPDAKWEALRKSVSENFPEYQIQKTSGRFRMSGGLEFAVQGDRVNLVISEVLTLLEV